MYDKKDIQYFYLREPQCRCIVSVIMGLVICNIIFAITNSIPFPEKFQKFVGEVGNWITMFGVGVLPIIQYIFKNVKQEIKRGSIIEIREPEIRRKKQIIKLTKLSKKHRIVILTGDSGSGKSVLLSKIKEKSAAYYKNNDYFLKWGEEVCRQKNEVIILDQFERALKLCNLNDNIRMILSARKRVIIGIKKENLCDILKIFGYNRHVFIFHLDYDNTDKKQIASMCEEIVGRNINEFKEKLFYKELTKKVNDNTIPLILVSFIWKIMEKENLKSLDEKWEECNRSFEKMASIYLENDIIDKLSYKNVAYPILYLLSRDSRFEYKCGINDLKNITFAEEEKISNTIDELIKIGLVRENVGKNIYRNDQSAKYEIAHEFYAQKIMEICTKKISTEIRGNIENYQESVQKKRFEKDEIVDSQYYKNLYNENRRKLVDKMLVFLCLMFIAENIICWVLKTFDLNCVTIQNKKFTLECFTTNNFILAFLNISIGLSVYYIYNYYCRFLIAFERRFIAINIVGGLVSILGFVFNRQWALFLGIEITFVGINMYFISKRARKSEQLFFIKRMQTFCAIGLMTMILGVFFSTYTKGSVFLTLPLFILYIGYMLMGVLGHINQNYILMILGKIGNGENYAKR